eukprot:951308-Amphidinium_carterae.2
MVSTSTKASVYMIEVGLQRLAQGTVCGRGVCNNSCSAMSECRNGEESLCEAHGGACCLRYSGRMTALPTLPNIAVCMKAIFPAIVAARSGDILSDCNT